MIEQAGEAVAHHKGTQHQGAADAAGHRGQQMLRLDRLGKKIVPAQIHRGQLFVEVFFGGKKHDGDADEVINLTDYLGQLHAVAAGHVHVDQDQIRLELQQRFHHHQRIVDCNRGHPSLLKHRRVISSERRRVIDDHYAVRGGRLTRSQLVEFVDQAT